MTVNLNAAYFPAVEFVAAVATVGIIIVGGRQAINGDIEIGVLVGFIAALNGFFDPIGQLSQVYTTYQSGMAALDKIFELLDVEPDLTDRPDAHRARAHPRRDPLRGRLLPLPHRGRGTKLALDDVSLMVPPGQTVALVGATGAGKSTFAKLVARFYDPTDGRVLVDGHDLRDVTARLAALADGHRAPGGVPVQRHDRRQHRLRPPGRRRGARSRPPRARSARGTSSRRCPTGLDTEVGERGVQLSAGQRQLVAFARALDRRPAHPGPRRGDVERRPAHRGPDRGRACGGCSPGAPRSSSPTACRPSARRGGSSCSTTAGSSSRAPTTS